ncbi:MAG: PqqD family protein [Lachnospiraceae bacterium]|nr:PqqD family protein [Lachnospiraceae bacterium]
MKIKGTFVLRSIMDENVLIPVGDTAAEINGMIALNKTGAAVWQGIEAGKTDDEIIETLVQRFEVEKSVAKEDYQAFTEGMKAAGILTE